MAVKKTYSSMLATWAK